MDMFILKGALMMKSSRRCANMATLTKAPKLMHQGEKTHSDCPEYRLPEDLMDIVLKYLTGNQLKLMIVLMGTKGNGVFSPSEKWIEQRTGLGHSRYIEARNQLCAMGWLRHRKSPAHDYYILTVNFDAIFAYTDEKHSEYKELKNVL